MSDTPARERFDGAALWAQLTQEEQREIGALVLEYTVNCLGEDALADQPGSPASRPFEEGNIVLLDALLDASEDELVRLKPFAAVVQDDGAAGGPAKAGALRSVLRARGDRARAAHHAGGAQASR